VIDYYSELMATIYSTLKGRYPTQVIPVWGISHAGHQIDELDPSCFPDTDGTFVTFFMLLEFMSDWVGQELTVFLYVLREFRAVQSRRTI
jgi:hypothetical protein